MRVALLAVSLIMLSSVFPLVWARAEPKVLKVYSSFDDGSLEPGTLSYAIDYIHKFPGRYVIVFESDLIVNASSNKVLYLNPIRSFVEIEFRGNGHKIRVYDFFKSKPSGCTLDKVVLRVNTVIPASMGSVVKVSNLEIIIDTNETDGYTSFISPLNIVAPVVILENITIRGRILGGDFYDNFAAIYTFGGENFFRNILADIYTSVPSSPHDFNANFFLDTPKTVFMENITSLLVANGRVVGVYVGTPAKWGARKVELVNVSSLIRVEQGYYTFGVWIRNARTAVAHVKVDVISNAPTVFGFVLTKVMQTDGEGFEVDIVRVIGADYVIGVKIEHSKFVNIRNIRVGIVKSSLRKAEMIYVKESSRVVVGNIEKTACTYPLKRCFRLHAMLAICMLCFIAISSINYFKEFKRILD